MSDLLEALQSRAYPGRGLLAFRLPDERLHVAYHLTSMTYRRRLRVETAVTVGTPHVASVLSVYQTADAHERETWDMFGIIFDGHPDRHRIPMQDA